MRPNGRFSNKFLDFLLYFRLHPPPGQCVRCVVFGLGLHLHTTSNRKSQNQRAKPKKNKTKLFAFPFWQERETCTEANGEKLLYFMVTQF